VFRLHVGTSGLCDANDRALNAFEACIENMAAPH
jgi:hypothetical protein